MEQPRHSFALVILERTGSTNDECKARALAGSGPVAVMAREQTGGRGRRGRSFQSLAGKGLYLSALLYPQAPPEQVSQLTAWTAVAVCRAIRDLTGLSPDIKWPNDILVGGKKLCGILTESGMAPGGLYVVVGIGVNLTQTAHDFGPDLSPIATSLAQLGRPVEAEALAHAILARLEAMCCAFPQGRAAYLADFRSHCVTLGRPVVLSTPQGREHAQALDVDDSFSLLVRTEDGTVKPVTSGEVSVRGLPGYA